MPYVCIYISRERDGASEAEIGRGMTDKVERRRRRRRGLICH